MQQASAAATAEFLRANDRDRYYASLVVPGETRSAIQAIAAFSTDVASIRERVSQPSPGEIRLQWWDDALTGKEHGDVRANPVADALLDTIATYNLPIVPLQRLIAARRFDLYGDPMPDLQSFEGYAGETVSVLYQFAAMILDKGEIIEEGDAAGHLGVAHALIGHMRAFAFNSSRGQIFLPWPVLVAHGVAEADIFSGIDGEGLRSAMAQFREMAREHLEKAKAAIRILPAKLRPAFAMIALLDAELTRLERRADNPFMPPVPLADWRRIGLLALWAWRNR